MPPPQSLRTERQTLVNTTVLFSDSEPDPFHVVKGSPPPTGGLFQAPDFEEVAPGDFSATATDPFTP